MDLPTLEDVRNNAPLPEDHLCVYWSGSSVAGWTHANSDLDCYVVLPGAPEVEASAVQLMPVDPPSVPIVSRTVGGTRWDVEFWRADQVDQLVERIAEWGGQGAARRIPITDEIDFLYRLRIGAAVSGSEWIEERKARIDELRFRDLLAQHTLNAADSFIEDAAGLLESGDVHTAVIAAREAFANVVDALSITEGQLSPSVKWRAKRFFHARPAALSWDEYWARETMQEFDPDQPEKWVTETIERCQDLILEIDVG